MKLKLPLQTLALVLALMSSGVTPAASQPLNCLEVTALKNSDVEIPHSEFDALTKNLRTTISGKLATVWRSEWKAKLRLEEANQMLLQAITTLLSLSSQKTVLDGLDPQKEGFIRELHKRMSKLPQASTDLLQVRSEPPPEGVADHSFTYYTEPIRDQALDESKHQLRLRGYIREIDFAKLAFHQNVEGFTKDLEPITYVREAFDRYLVVTNSKVEERFTLIEMQKRFGIPVRIYPPHGKGFKLEVKTALDDKILGKIYTKLTGRHMVQKLDVNLSPVQIRFLFGPLPKANANVRRVTSYKRINQIKRQLMSVSPENEKRIDAVLAVLRVGVKNDADFLIIKGATLYNRTAFESPLGFQLTVDRLQRVFAGQMYSAKHNVLADPFQVLQTQSSLSAREEDARHVELKFPVNLVQRLLGLETSDAGSIPQAREENDGALHKILAIYSSFLRNDDHPGKFNYLLKTGQQDPE